MVKEIPLQNGKVALVDDEDYERCMQHIWAVIINPDGVTIRVVANIRNCSTKLTRFILRLEKHEEVLITFRDKNPLNCQKSNLCQVNHIELRRRSRGHKGSSSKYKGVSWKKQSSKWEASIRIEGKRKHLGYFADEDEAARVYNAAALDYFGEHAYQNIIGTDNNATEVDSKTIVGTKIGQRRRLNSTSKFKGVSWDKQSSKWLARITIGGKQKYLGRFDNEKEAAKAYDKKAYELHGDKAILNFPELIDGYKANAKPELVLDDESFELLKELAEKKAIQNYVNSL